MQEDLETLAPLMRPIDSASWREVTTLTDLTAIFATPLNLVYLARQLTAGIVRAAEREAVCRTGELRVITSADAPAMSDLLPGAPNDALTADMIHLVEIFSMLTGAVEVGLRLHVLNGAMCPRFHTDRVLLRLICTYLGPGTEWLDNGNVRRDRLGHRADGVSDLESGAIIDSAEIKQMPAGAIGLFKGEAWAGAAGHAAVHRSPAVQDVGPRLLFTIDAIR